MSDEKHVCTKSVSDASGYHFWPCKRPAKFLVTYTDGRAPKYRCGIHAHARNPKPFSTVTRVSP